MAKNDQTIMPPILERYELKYHIPYELIEPISEFISPYCNLDYYSEIAEDKFYPIRNVYFDTSDFLFLRNKLESHPDKINMRVRFYTDDSPLLFCEVKNKVVDTVKKYRGKVSADMFKKLFTTKNTSSHEKEKIDKNTKYFMQLKETYNISPKVLTQYKRKAYFSHSDEYARVTFDRDLCYRFQEGYDIKIDNDTMIPYDTVDNFEPNCSVILELKCYTVNVPFWMIDLVKRFGLVRSNFSKYATGVSEVLNSDKIFDNDLSSAY